MAHAHQRKGGGREARRKAKERREKPEKPSPAMMSNWKERRVASTEQCKTVARVTSIIGEVIAAERGGVLESPVEALQSRIRNGR